MAELEKTLQKEMTRKEFLLAAIAAAGSLMGISAAIGAFTKTTGSHKSHRPGYGFQNYGP